jgi:putative salt-induced outer membrane protein YdiY
LRAAEGLASSPAPAVTPNAPAPAAGVATPDAPVSFTNTTSLGPPSPSLPDLSWVPPADAFDWIQLKSGEWLKGRLKAMQERQLEFDSEEMDDQTFDWKDIRQVRTARIIDALFVDGRKVSGTVEVTPTLVTVNGSESETRLRLLLQSLTPGGDRENYWSGKFSLGLTARSGNSEQLESNTQLKLQRRTPGTRFKLDYLGNVTEVENAETANNHRINTEFDFWLSQRLYLIFPALEYYRDTFQNISDRVTGGGGVGYDVVAQANLEWTLTGGPGYQWTRYESALPGEPEEEGDFAVSLGTRLKWDITRRVEFNAEYTGTFTSEESGKTTHHGELDLSIDITRRLDLDVSLIWDRIENPQIGADGVEPQKNDYRLIVGLGVDF